MDTGLMVWLMTLAGLAGGAVATFARRVPWISNKAIPLLTIVVTAAANFVLVGRKFLESAGAPVAWYQWAPPTEGGIQAIAGWSWGAILTIAISILSALKVQFPLQRMSFEKGEAAALYPDRVKAVPVEMASISAPKGKAK